jgi:RimJ/RimL family protein N-acetyltransferase
MAEKDGAPVGTVRFDRRDHERWELSWTIAPEHRGKGLGKEVVKGATQLMSSDLIARIKACNSSSISIARHAGFEPLPNPDGDPLTWWILRR